MSRLIKNRCCSIWLLKSGVANNVILPAGSAHTLIDAGDATTDAEVLRLYGFQAEEITIKTPDSAVICEFSIGGSYNATTGALTGETSQGKFTVPASSITTLRVAFENIKLTFGTPSSGQIEIFCKEKAD